MGKHELVNLMENVISENTKILKSMGKDNLFARVELHFNENSKIITFGVELEPKMERKPPIKMGNLSINSS